MSGVAVIISSAIIGTVWRLWIYPKAAKLRWLNVYVMSFLVHVAMIACLLLLPYPVRVDVIREITLPVLLIYPVVSVLLFLLLTQQQVFLQVRDKLKQSEERFRVLFDKAPLDINPWTLPGILSTLINSGLILSDFQETRPLEIGLGIFFTRRIRRNFLKSFRN